MIVFNVKDSIKLKTNEGRLVDSYSLTYSNVDLCIHNMYNRLDRLDEEMPKKDSCSFKHAYVVLVPIDHAALIARKNDISKNVKLEFVSIDDGVVEFKINHLK